MFVLKKSGICELNMPGVSQYSSNASCKIRRVMDAPLYVILRAKTAIYFAL